MNIDLYSDRAKQAIQSAQSLALARGHQQLVPEHLLKVLLEEKDGLARQLIQSAGGKPDLAAWRWLYFQYLRWLVPVFGRLFCGDADTHGYILDSLRKFPAQRGVDAKLHELGYAKTQVVNLLGGIMGINYGRKRVD